MFNTTPSLLKTKPLLWGLAFVRLLLHAVVLFVVAIFPCAAPTLGSRTVTESEKPVDQDETSQEKDVNLQARTRVGGRQRGVPLLVPGGSRPSVSAQVMVRASRSGHRLPNNLLAPLRC